MAQYTRECTQICYNLAGTEQKPAFKVRKLDKRHSPGVKPFETDDTDDHQLVYMALAALIKSVEVKKNTARERGTRKLWMSQVRRNRINAKRQLLHSYMSRQSLINLKEAAKYAGVDVGMARKVRRDMLMKGGVELFEYPNLKSEAEVQALTTSIDNITSGYDTVSDLKRAHQGVSRKWILKELHRRGLRYRKMARNTLKPKEKPNSNRICQVICHLAEALTCSDVEVLYIDEMHFPLFQTSNKHWTVADPSQNLEELLYNRRPSVIGKLTAIALCSTQRVEAVQLFIRDVSAVDFSYFLCHCFQFLPKDKRYTVLADNATWHTAESVAHTRAGKLLFFNQKGMYQLNMIENVFSFIRAAFRKRELVATIQQGAQLIMKIFFDPQNDERFKGVFRSHLRNLVKYLQIHSPYLDLGDC